MKTVSTALIIITLMLVSACVVNPVTGKKQVSFMTEAQEKNIGAQNDPAIIAQFGLYENQELQNFINRKGQEMVKISHRPDLGYEFKILDSPVINAFALPGGYVYFTRGIMAHFNNEAQFAGVLGHEIGHVTARHSAEQYTKQTIGQILLIGGLIISPEFRNFANEAQQGLGLLFLSFSRGNESESDELGVAYSSEVGYDAHQMAEFFKTLDKAMTNSENGRIPEFLSTHPDPGRRYETVHKLAAEWQSENGATGLSVDRDGYLRMIEGIVYGEDPRQGYVDNQVFYHPELKFQFPFPNDWNLVNSPLQVQIAPKDGKALTIFTLSQQKTLKAAADEIVQQQKLQVQRDLNFKIDGMPAYGMVSDQVNSDPATGKSSTIAVQSVLIQYGDLIYVFHGLCNKPDFSKYEQYFDYIMNNFKKLNDPSRINVKPEVVDVVPVKNNGTISQALRDYNMSSNRITELATLNGMDNNETVRKGQLIKIVVKSSR